jgi:hypothetical protein
MLFTNEVELEDKGGSKIPVGIHTNCEVTSYEFNKADNYYQFNYKDSEGRVHNFRKYFPDITKMDPKYFKEGENAMEAYVRISKSRFAPLVKHYAVLFGADTISNLEAADLMSAAQKAQLYFTPLEMAKVKVNLKLVPTQDGKYSTFQSYNVHFIEKYEEGVPSTLSFSNNELKDIEKMNSAKAAVNGTNSSVVNDDDYDS